MSLRSAGLESQRFIKNYLIDEFSNMNNKICLTLRSQPHVSRSREVDRSITGHSPLYESQTRHQESQLINPSDLSLLQAP